MDLKHRHVLLNLMMGTTVVFVVVSYIIVNKTCSHQAAVHLPSEVLGKSIFRMPSESGLANDQYIHTGDDTADKNVRVLIWVMTSPQNLNTQAKAVKETWAKRCNKIMFFSSENNTDFPAIGLQVPEGRRHLTEKTMKAFRYVYEHHFRDADWFMKVDDDAYIIMENLLYFLSRKNAAEPVYFGQHFNSIVKQGYHSGGAGYVLSKEALRRFGERGTDKTICRTDGFAEDVDMGFCMERLGVRAEVSTDSLGRSLFHTFRPRALLFARYPDWFSKYVSIGSRQGQDSISEYAISFHHLTPEMLFLFDFHVYHLKIHGANKS